MNRDDIIRMAQECQLIGIRPHLDGVYQESLERFAALVAAREREECAKVCDGERDYWKRNEGRRDGAESCAKAIRARGEA